MAGGTPAGQLEAGRTGFTVAGPEHDAGLRQLLRENPMGGAIRLTFEREPEYRAGAEIAGAEETTIAAHQAGRLICMGRGSVRPLWLDGAERRVGYLAELRLDHRARGQFAVLREGYRFYRAQEAVSPPEFRFTSIASDNQRARRVLERGVRGLPAYTFLGELKTLLIPVRRRTEATLPWLPAREEEVPEIVRLLNEQGRASQLAPVWSEARLRSLAQHGLPLPRFFCLRGGHGLRGVGALWDQRGFRQTVVQRYPLRLRLARPLLRATARLFGTARLPAVGEPVAQAILSPWALRRGESERLPDLVEALASHAAAAGVEYLTLALPADDPRLLALRQRFSPRVWSSRLYQVTWPGEPVISLSPERRCQPEAGLL